MRLAISNIAWSPQERDEVFALLSCSGVRGLEIAPTLAFPEESDPFSPSKGSVSEFMRSVERHGLSLVSMQSLLFGVQDAFLFGAAHQSERFEWGLRRAANLASELGIPNLVMGSPAARARPDSMKHNEAERLAIDAFRRIGDHCLDKGAKLALEPNPASYGTNFLTTVAEAIEFAQAVDHPAITLNFDIGCLHVTGEINDASAWFAKAGRLVSHVHVSEPNLAPAPQDQSQFATLAAAIINQGYDGWLSIEMRTVEENRLTVIKGAIEACLSALRAVQGSIRP